jgi:hypothetical protein
MSSIYEVGACILELRKQAEGLKKVADNPMSKVMLEAAGMLEAYFNVLAEQRRSFSTDTFRIGSGTAVGIGTAPYITSAVTSYPHGVVTRQVASIYEPGFDREDFERMMNAMDDEMTGAVKGTK